LALNIKSPNEKSNPYRQMKKNDNEIKRAAMLIGEADALLITAGAGVGVDSGLPDFRGTSGFWKAYPPIQKLGISFSEMANPIWFQQRPKLAWAFYGHRLNLYRKTIPHNGYRIMQNWASKMNGDYFVFTSNVDGQFQMSGFDDNRIEECHGSIHHLQCSDPCSNQIWDADHITVDVDESCFEAKEPLPQCPNCSRIARPNILMFGDWNWIVERSDEQHRRLSHWLDNNYENSKRLVIVELGAGTAVATVRHTSQSIADRFNATLVRINPRDYQVPPGHVSIPLGALEGLSAIDRALME